MTWEPLSREGKALEGERTGMGCAATAAVLRTCKRGKPVNPRIGSRLQHACESRVAQAVEAVGNREDGTSLELAAPGRGRARTGNRPSRAGGRARDDVDGGEIFETTLRKALGANRPGGKRSVSECGVRTVGTGGIGASRLRTSGRNDEAGSSIRRSGEQRPLGKANDPGFVRQAVVQIHLDPQHPSCRKGSEARR